MTADRDAFLEALAARVADPRVLAAVAATPREAFVAPELADRAYEDGPLPIGAGQTISQPSLVAHMCERLALRGDESVLDVGTGSGYAAALLARLAGRVVSVERHAELSAWAAGNLAAAGVEGVDLVVGDGARGWPARAPFHAIHVAAAARRLPPALGEQLADGGRMVIPVGRRQRLAVVRREGAALRTDRGQPVRFVPLVES